MGSWAAKLAPAILRSACCDLSLDQLVPDRPRCRFACRAGGWVWSRSVRHGWAATRHHGHVLCSPGRKTAATSSKLQGPRAEARRVLQSGVAGGASGQAVLDRFRFIRIGPKEIRSDRRHAATEYPVDGKLCELAWRSALLIRKTGSPLSGSRSPVKLSDLGATAWVSLVKVVVDQSKSSFRHGSVDIGNRGVNSIYR